MRLIRWGDNGSEKPGILARVNTIRDLSGVVEDIAGETLSSDSAEQLRALNHQDLPTIDPGVRIGACVGSGGIDLRLLRGLHL